MSTPQSPPPPPPQPSDAGQPEESAPYGYAPPGGSAGLSKAALFTGIGSLGSFILAIALTMIGASSGHSTLRDMAPVIVILALLSLLAGLVAIVLGIVTLSMASKNPSMSKVHGILAICFGAIPVILWLFGLANGSRRW